MKQFIRIGVDLAKRYFQIHALELESGKATTRKLSRSVMHTFFAQIEPCLIGMEACGSSHYWARELRAMGHDVRLLAPIYVKPYVKRGKNDAADAAAICEAMSRPDMRFVPIKSEESQATLMLHKARDLMIKQRTMIVNALRGHLAEFGIVAAKGIGRVEALIAAAHNEAALPAMVKATLDVFIRNLAAIDAAIADLDQQIAKGHSENPVSQLLAGIPGVGTITATAIVASVPTRQMFTSGRDFAAWRGMTPRQNSSGGKEKLGAITKQGNRTLRRFLVMGATSLLRSVSKRKGTLRDWLAALLARKPARLVTLALANKLARIAWAIMMTGEMFRAESFERA